jgi:predicted transcriptional regulator
MIVEQIMNRDVKACHPQDSLNLAAQIMWDNACGAVVDEQSRPIGFLADRDVCMAAYTHALRVLSTQQSMTTACLPLMVRSSTRLVIR